MKLICFDQSGRKTNVTSIKGLYNILNKYNTTRYCIIQNFRSAEAKIIKDIILSYPEINFFFTCQDWHYTLFNLLRISVDDLDPLDRELKQLKTQKEDVERKESIKNSSVISKYKRISSELEAICDDVTIDNKLKQIERQVICNTIESSFHYVSEEVLQGQNFQQRLSELSNLFDASNLRYAIKKIIFKEKSIHENYSNFYQTRADNIAYVVDEESQQCQLHSYCMYANGYRVLPITSKRLLLQTSNLRKKKDNHLTIRDFDLQFRDEQKDIEEYEKYTTDKRKDGYSETDFIRGFKYTSIDKWENLLQKRICDFMGCSSNCCYENPYWHESEYESVYCASQGYDNLKFKRDSGWSISDDRKQLFVPGIKKPVVGIYESLNNNIQKTKEVRKKLRTFSEEHPRRLDRTRIGHNHNVELDLYDQALSIYSRSQKYYEQGEFILSAVLSQEVIEILNGYHTSLALRALLVHAKAENAIAMSVLGCNEDELANDCQIRIGLIQEDVNRMVSDTTFKETNILNQIFSDCRLYCHEKEHFKSEEVFIDAMAKLNEGIDINKCKQFFKEVATETKTWYNNIIEYGRKKQGSEQ